jgi:hypothetical protein
VPRWIFLTIEEKPLRGIHEFMLCFRAGDWIEPSDTMDFLDAITRAIIRIRVGPQHAAQVCFEPKFLRRSLLVASLVYAITFDSSWNGDLDTHIQT